MGIHLKFRLLNFLLSITLFEIEVEKIMSEEEKIKHMQSMGLIPQVLDSEESEKKVPMGFQGTHKKETEDE